MIKEVCKFYRENLFPIEPPPSFRNVLMWALQKEGRVCAELAIRGREAGEHWAAAAEAIWALLMVGCSGEVQR